MSCTPDGSNSPWVILVRQRATWLNITSSIQMVLGVVAMVLQGVLIGLVAPNFNNPQNVCVGFWGGGLMVISASIGLAAVARANHHTPCAKAVMILFIMQYTMCWVCIGAGGSQVMNFNIQTWGQCTSGTPWCVTGVLELAITQTMIGILMIFSVIPVLAIYLQGTCAWRKSCGPNAAIKLPSQPEKSPENGM